MLCLLSGRPSSTTAHVAEELSAAYPNPFNPLTNITYELARGMDVHLAVYSLDGSLVRVLGSGHRGQGLHAFTWNGLDRTGRAMLSGVYLYRLKAGDTVQLRRMILVR
ncbi:MAG: T9SS type A sorting domain-containing protein [bacterium]|nr:T9SS type A sorting domain-containing protein [bacterium]